MSRSLLLQQLNIRLLLAFLGDWEKYWSEKNIFAKIGVPPNLSRATIVLISAAVRRGTCFFGNPRP